MASSVRFSDGIKGHNIPASNRMPDTASPVCGQLCLANRDNSCFIKTSLVRIWWNWQTRYFEVVVGQPVQVQVLLCAPVFQRKPVNRTRPPKIPQTFRGT